MLEDKGWTFHRIWSTDWFRDPEAEKAALKSRIQERLTELRASRRETSSVVDFEAALQSRRQTVVAEESPRSNAQTERDGKALSAKQGDALALGESGSRPVTEPPVGAIRIGSKILIEKVADGQRMSFVLSKDRNDPGSGFLAVHTPLGEALLEAEEGEKVSYVVGPHVHQVRVLSVG